MSTEMQAYNDQLRRQQEAANAMRQTLVRSQFDEGGNFISDQNLLLASIQEAVSNDPIYAAMGEHGLATAMIHIQAIKDFAEEHGGQMPSDMLLASARQELENMYVDKAVGGKDMILSAMEAQSVATSEGVPTIVTTAQVSLPRLLASQTLDVVTYVSGTRSSELEYFEIETVAASDLGDYKKGEKIGLLDGGQYSNLVQHFAFPEKGDGTKKSFTFTSQTDTPAKKKLPIVKKSVQVYIAKELAASDQGNGKLFGTFHQGETEITVNGDVTYDTGVVVVTATEALASDVEIEVEIQINIEAAPELIPEISQVASSFKLRPALRVLRSTSSLQSQWKMSSDLNIDLRSLNLTSLRDHLAAQDDLHVIQKLAWLAKTLHTIDCAPKAGSNDNTIEGFELVRVQLNEVSDDMMTKSEDSGLEGIYCTREAAAFFKNTPSFRFAKGYKQQNRIHFVGIAFDRYRIYEVPQKIAELKPGEAVGYGKSSIEGRAPYLKGDINAPTLIDHEINKGLTKSDTIMANGYSALNPKHGQNLICKLKFINQ
ncbi:hypothetical protein [Vibrio europaeus]|uniref:hypothetical protein n=1 Tax=Vibrio europaeus TaxID=300876 RepID=UPI00233EF78A|nr:hypothetical protein [Vibrio europaeus]MDC5753613.1 hypothetical protein [Vibrio europaeus]MDC5816474.1 hypothetical protein [Vibrio europaeus]